MERLEKQVKFGKLCRKLHKNLKLGNFGVDWELINGSRVKTMIISGNWKIGGNYRWFRKNLENSNRGKIWKFQKLGNLRKIAILAKK